MKKFKKLHLNKIRIVTLKNTNIIYGGSANTGCTNTNTCADQQSINPDIICDSTGITYGGDDGGTFRSTPPPPTQECSAVLTECELADM